MKLRRLNEYPGRTDISHRALHPRAEAQGQQALSARADARAVVPVQSGVLGLRQDRLPRRDPAQAHVRRGRAARRRRVRRARRLDSRRRAADPQGDAADRRGHHRAQEVRLSVHERAAARAEARSVHAVAVFDVLGSLGRQQGPPRCVRVPRRHVRQGRVRDQGRARERLPRDGELHAVRRRGSRGRRELLRLHE